MMMAQREMLREKRDYEAAKAKAALEKRGWEDARRSVTAEREQYERDRSYASCVLFRIAVLVCGWSRHGFGLLFLFLLCPCAVVPVSPNHKMDVAWIQSLRRAKGSLGLWFIFPVLHMGCFRHRCAAALLADVPQSLCMIA